MSGISGLLAVAVFVLTFVAPVQAQEREYTTIVPPDEVGDPQLPTTASTAFGINARGDIVGTFVEGGVQHGFLLSKGKFTVIDFPETPGYPKAEGTIARGIGPSGEIVGSYWLPGDNPMLAARGFRRTKKGEFLNVRYGDPFPEHSWEIAQRILPNGTILGCRHDTDQMATMRGITIGKDGPSEIEAFGSMNNGATPDGNLIVGLWFNMMMNQQQGYTIENGVFTPFTVPGSNFTAAWDVNADGVIVGVFRVGTTFRGFARSGESYTTIHYPGSAITRAFGINDSGDIVGNYVLGGVTYAFVARVVEE
ncbi:MAG TPA: hypothetical protein VFZ40_16495 [Pyrinomonadaceae bacterium]